MITNLDEPIQNKRQLIQYFIDGIKKNDQLRIGVEHEKFLFNKDDLNRVNYNQIKKLFEILTIRGWELQLEKDKIIGLKRDNQKITTEPGFQYELSGAPFKNIHSVCAENSKHFKELKEVFETVSITTSSIAYDPFNKLQDIPKSPKERKSKTLTNFASVPRFGIAFATSDTSRGETAFLLASMLSQVPGRRHVAAARHGRRPAREAPAAQVRPLRRSLRARAELAGRDGAKDVERDPQCLRAA